MKDAIVQDENAYTHLKNSNVRSKTLPVSAIDVSGLIQELRTNISGEVRFDDGARALYATDGSHYRQVPIGVVIPKNVDEVITTVAACHQYKAPIVLRGGGTSLAGQGCNVAVVIDLSKYMHNLLELDPSRKIAHTPTVPIHSRRSFAQRPSLVRPHW